MREVELDSPITVIKGDNSQGKTATAEALEFLFTGRSSRRDLFGGAKAEYDRMLANVHLPRGDFEVWVEADVRCIDGLERRVRRTLAVDYSASSECESIVEVDSRPVDDLDSLGIPFGEPPLAAPVLLQHNLRYVLSTAPQQRAAYFRALLDLTDLDQVREAVARARVRVSGLPPLARVSALSALGDAARANDAATGAVGITGRATSLQAVTTGLVSVAKALNPTIKGDTADAVIAELQAIKQLAEERVFPIAALTPSTSNAPTPLDSTRLARSYAAYTNRLLSADAEAARLAPILDAVVGHPLLGHLSEPTTCPVCEDGTLGPDRIRRIREQLVAAADMQAAASDVTNALQSALAEIEGVGRSFKSLLPEAQHWGEGQWGALAVQLDSLRGESPPDGPRVDLEVSARGPILRANAQIQHLREVWSKAKNLADATNATVRERAEIRDEMSPLLGQVGDCIGAFRGEVETLARTVDALHGELGDRLQSATLPWGTREVLDLLEHRNELHRELSVARQRDRVRQRIETLGRCLQAAEEALLDERFDSMGLEIDRWWATLRPNELVRFGGVGRRASGRRYVNLTAELAASDDTAPQVRDAVGVFSDSQLNALGLAAFLARQRLLDSPVVVLDDPLPGYDPEHRVTFTLNTLGALLDQGVQVIVCTHDPKLAVNIAEVHGYRGLERYELALSDMIAGTSVTNETDVFGRYLLEAQDSIASLTVEGRRNAANALRRAAERLAKQIIATGRTQAGTTTRVSEVGDKVLGELIPAVLGFALGNDERGRWNLWKASLNPSAHDNDVPLSQTLKTVLGDIKKLKRAHEAYWPGGLLK